MKKTNKKFLYQVFLALVLANLTLSTQGQEIPPDPANVISNYYTASYSNLPVAILFQTTNATVQVTNAVGKIWDVNFRTEITHTWNGDLNILLTSPQGTQVSLTSGDGGFVANGGSVDDVFNGTWWDDQAPTNSADAVYVNNVVQPFLQPEGALSAFDGENPNGTWTLTIRDANALDNGSLNGARLDIGTYIGKPTYVTKSYTNSTSTPIPDNASINPTVSVTGLPYRVSQVKVFTKIPHTTSGDLDVTLTSPAGTIVTLVTDRGGANDNNFNGTLWSDEAPETAGNVTNIYTDLVVKTNLIPEGCLATFKGENPNGTWTLTVADDNLNAQTGNLDNWYVEITTASAGVNDVNGDGYTDIIGIKRKEVRVLSQAAGVTTSNAVSYGSLPKGYKAVGGYDVNTNGLSDLIIQRKDQISYLDITNGAASATPIPIATAPKHYKAVASGDINSDDYTDIIVTRGKTIGALMGPGYIYQEITDANKNGKVVGAVQTNIVTQKGKKVYRTPVTSNGTNAVTVGTSVTLTEDAAGKVVGVSEINANEGYEILAQKKKAITYGAWDSGTYTTALWTDKDKEKDGQVGAVVAPQ